MPRFSKYPYVQHQQMQQHAPQSAHPLLPVVPKNHPNPPVPRHGSTPPPRANGRFTTPTPPTSRLASLPVVSVSGTQGSGHPPILSPIRSCSETESGGSPLNPTASGHVKGLLTPLGPVQLQKSSSAPPLKRPPMGPASGRIPFEFPAPPPPTSKVIFEKFEMPKFADEIEKFIFR